MSAQVQFSQRSQHTADQPISYFMKQAVENPHLISLAAGLVDSNSLPGNEVNEALHEILSEPLNAQAALQYGTTQGYAPLRELLLQRTCALDGLQPEELQLSADNVAVTTGSQQLLYLVGEMLLDPGDIVIAAAPSYFVYQGALTSFGARTIAIPMDEDGIKTDELATVMDRLDSSGEINKLRMVYVMDYFQNPSGRTLSENRRHHLFELIKRYSKNHRIILLEDAAYRELRYDGDDILSIKSLDADNEFVILTMTFSKPLSPGLKTGYGILPSDLVDPLLRLKGNHDFGSNNLTQHLLHRLLETGAYDRHVTELCHIYREKRDAMLGALCEAFSTDGVTGDLRWTHPGGGLYIWLTFPDWVDFGPNGQLMDAALLEGVLYVPGEFCYMDNGGPKPRNEARLSFGVERPDKLREGVFRLARAAKKIYPQLVGERELALAQV